MANVVANIFVEKNPLISVVRISSARWEHDFQVPEAEMSFYFYQAKLIIMLIPKYTIDFSGFILLVVEQYGD